MKKIIRNNLIGIIIGIIISGTVGVVASTTISSKNVVYQNKTVNSALDELYDEAITGKELIAAAITNKGIATTASDTYEVMANNISNITTGTTLVKYLQLGVSGKTNVTATVVLQKVSPTIANLHINYRVNENLGTADNDFMFINLKTLRDSFNLTSLNFNAYNTRVTVFNTSTTFNDDYFKYNGYSGLHADIHATDYLLLCREYRNNGSFGGWPISQPMYSVGSYGQIDIWGATIS